MNEDQENEIESGISVDEEDEVIWLPVEEIREFGLPDCVSELSLDAAATFAEAIGETQEWIGDPVEASFEDAIILRSAFKVVGAMMAGAKFVPVIDKLFDSEDEMLAYAASEEKPVMLHRTTGGGTRIGQIAWDANRPSKK